MTLAPQTPCGIRSRSRRPTSVRGRLTAAAAWVVEALEGRTLFSAATLVADVNTHNPGIVYQDNALEPVAHATIGGTGYFIALDSHGDAAGYELWKTDGTSAGTSLVTGGLIFPNNKPVLVSDGQRLYFPAYTTAVTAGNGFALWTSDGTAAGTVPVTGSFPGRPPSNVLELTPGAGVVYFTAEDFAADYTPLHGQELWRSDGTAAGTYLVKNVIPGPSNGGDYPANTAVIPHHLRVTGDLAYFAIAPDGYHDQLSRSDGTDAGTFAVATTIPAAGADPGAVSAPNGSSGDPNRYEGAFDGKLYYSGWTAQTGNELCVTDGTVAGTHVVKDLVPGGDPGATFQNSSYPADFVESGGKVYFHINQNQLWVTDGTADGTVQLANTAAGMADVNGRLMFLGAQTPTGVEVWGTDGTVAGTAQTGELRPGYWPGVNYDYTKQSAPFFIGLGDKLLFNNYVGATGLELWASDGTTAGTAVLRDINPGPLYSSPYNAFVLNGKLLFTADNGVDGAELWATDGTGAGTALVRNINTDTAPSSPHGLVNVGGTVFFVADDGNATFQQRGNGGALFRTDGTAGGTIKVSDVAPFSPQDADSELSAGGLLYYAGVDPATGEKALYRSDGTPEGTFRLNPSDGTDLTFSSGGAGSGRGFVDAGDGTVYFFGWDATHGQELWKTDGTPAGTSMVIDLNPASAGGVGYGFRADTAAMLNGTLYFVRTVPVGDANTPGEELWKTDGTAAGTVLVESFPSTQTVTKISSLTPAGNAILLQRVRRPARVRALEDRRHRGGDGDRQGHLPRPRVVPGEPDGRRQHAVFRRDRFPVGRATVVEVRRDRRRHRRGDQPHERRARPPAGGLRERRRRLVLQRFQCLPARRHRRVEERRDGRRHRAGVAAFRRRADDVDLPVGRRRNPILPRRGRHLDAGQRGAAVVLAHRRDPGRPGAGAGPAGGVRARVGDRPFRRATPARPGQRHPVLHLQ